MSANPVPMPRRPADDVRPAATQERNRIAAELQDLAIQAIFAVGLDLEAVAAITDDPLVRGRVDKAIADLDAVIRHLRDAVFGPQHHGLRAGILRLCEQLSPVPDVSFKGPVDGVLRPGVSGQVLEILDEALGHISQRLIPVLIDVTACEGACVIVVQAMPLPDPVQPPEPGAFASLQARAGRAGIGVEIHPGPDGTRFSWHIGLLGDRVD